MKGWPEGPAGVWGERPLPEPGETRRLDVGPLSIWLRTVENELRVTSHLIEDDGERPGDVPEDAAWSRWVLPDDLERLAVTPVLPDRPLVVKSEHVFALMRRAKARIYVRLPVWVRLDALTLKGTGRTRLMEIPTTNLSETWWGDFQDGELAFWLATSGRRHITPDIFEPHLAVSAIQLDNRSDDDLPVEKHLLRVEHLSLYEKDGWLWAEEVRVVYHGESEGSEIHMDDLPPAEAAGAVEISPARHQTRSFRARTFARLRALTSWGG